MIPTIVCTAITIGAWRGEQMKMVSPGPAGYYLMWTNKCKDGIGWFRPDITIIGDPPNNEKGGLICEDNNGILSNCSDLEH